MPTTAWIDEFATRALIASDVGEGTVRLLHSLEEPIIDQLATN
jgi:hypothetical protein